MQEAIGMQVDEPFEDLSYHGLYFVLVERAVRDASMTSTPRRRSGAPFEYASERPSFDERCHNSYSGMIRWECKGRKDTGSVSAVCRLCECRKSRLTGERWGGDRGRAGAPLWTAGPSRCLHSTP